MEKTTEQQLIEAKSYGYDLIAQRDAIENAMRRNNEKILQLMQKRDTELKEENKGPKIERAN